MKVGYIGISVDVCIYVCVAPVCLCCKRKNRSGQIYKQEKSVNIETFFIYYIVEFSTLLITRTETEVPLK